MRRQLPAGLFLRIAIQDLSRQPVRTALLAVAVMVAGGASFTAAVLHHALDTSIGVAMDRLGADVMLLPRATQANLVAALLTAEPSAHTIDAESARRVAALPAAERLAAQRFVALPNPDGHGEDALVIFDPAHDFTVLPWLAERLDRPLQQGDVIIGGRRPESVGGVAPLFGRTFPVYGKLGLTGVGPFERSYFVSPETAKDVAEAAATTLGAPLFEPSLTQPSALLVQLKQGATPEQFRFDVARLPQLQVVAGNGLICAVRHALSALLRGSAVFILLTLLTTTILVATLYTGVLAGRPRELGLLLSLGMPPRAVQRLLLAEAALTTGLGGVGGALVGTAALVLFRRSFGFVFERAHVPFELPSWPELVVVSLLSTLVWCGVGMLGAWLPALRATRREPYCLVRAEVV